ncbi:MAG: carboxypeptidase regulatory-like domain-containing protein [bacterium]|nr:carboxypeptidase regulatory-like domain-containing protein [bacterium]
MEQHPVPQQISSYEFRLVGDMTLKQFGMVAGGIIGALIIKAIPMPGLLQWFFMIISGASGAAFAFLPFEERPLQTWLIAFLKACYSPTQYIWQKNARRPTFFDQKSTFKPAPVVAPSHVSPQDSQKLNNYLDAFRSPKFTMDEKEESFTRQIQSLFSSVTLPGIGHSPKQYQAYNQIIKEVLPAEKKAKDEKVEVKIEEEKTEQSRPQPAPIITPRKFEEPEPVAQRISHYVPPLPGNIFRPKRSQIAEEARFAPQIPMPSVPTIPNVLVGMVIDPTGKMVEGAIIEIRDSQGNPVRAFRTNKLGQFRIVTPLPNDDYEVEVEKDGLKFDIIKVSLSGDIIKPIEIRAKGAMEIPEHPQNPVFQ